MGSLSNYAETAFVQHLCGTSQTPPTNLYIGLCTADPGEAATGASCSETANSNGYARKAITFDAAASRKVVQATDIAFDQATGNWASPITHWVIVDSVTYGAGNVWAYGAFNPTKTIYNLNTPTAPDGTVQVQFSAGGWSDYVVHKLLDHFFRNTSYTQPATYASLYTTTCSDSASGTEVTGGNYAQVLVNKAGGSSPAWATVSGGATSNNNAITFPTANASWGTVVSSGMEDVGGNLLVYDNATSDQAVASGDTAQYAIGEWDVSAT